MLNYLDMLDARGVKFALSNVLRNKGKENELLLNWIEKNQKKYRIIPLNYSYANSSYQTKNRQLITEEVLIVNY